MYAHIFIHSPECELRYMKFVSVLRSNVWNFENPVLANDLIRQIMILIRFFEI